MERIIFKGEEMENLKISVIISVYNKLEQLKNILLALNNQIELPFEVVIADDGSSEILEEKIGDIIPKLKYTLKHVYQNDKGFRLASSRNNGLNYSLGDYILFIDQDILFDEYFIKDIKENIKKGEVLKINALFLDEERTKKINEKIIQNNNFDYIPPTTLQTKIRYLLYYPTNNYLTQFPFIQSHSAFTASKEAYFKPASTLLFSPASKFALV